MLGCHLIAHGQASSASSPTVISNPSVPAAAAVTPGISASPDANPIAIPQSGPPPPLGLSPTDTSAARLALPANGDIGSDNTNHKWYIITAGLRETYDDNANTTSNNQQTALETSISPSLLVDFPRPDGDFSARYTFGLTYYEYLTKDADTVNGAGSSNQSSVQFTNELIANYSHNFSSRFSITAADDVRYWQDPSLLQSVGTLYQNGPYVANTFNTTLSAQWTPLFGTTSSYANTVTHYFTSAIADTQDSVENTGTQTFGFTVLPKVIANFGFIIDDVTYNNDVRGYSNYTGFVGGTWQVLPSLTIDGRGGATYNITDASPNSGGGQTGVSPYAALNINWTLGARSSLAFSYSHEITPTDQASANGQESDRLSANFTYQITPSITSHLSAVYTYSDITSGLLSSSSVPSYTESDYGIDTGVSYHYSNYLSFDFGVMLTGVSSELAGRDYTRDQVSIGVTGIY